MTTTLEYALMAGGSYISTRTEINRFDTPAGWTERIQNEIIPASNGHCSL
jgi:hypothetical protein